MGMTPIHPNLLLDRPMTRSEFIDAIRYEGMFGFGEPDRAVAEELAAEGLIEISDLNGGRVATYVRA